MRVCARVRAREEGGSRVVWPSVRLPRLSVPLPSACASANSDSVVTVKFQLLKFANKKEQPDADGMLVSWQDRSRRRSPKNFRPPLRGPAKVKHRSHRPVHGLLKA